MNTSLIRIDRLTRSEHSRLERNDEVYYMIEYHAKKGYSYSEENQLIHNLKKKMEKRSQQYEWRHKIRAIDALSTYLSTSLSDYVVNIMTFVPIPTSKRKDHDLYDDRLIQILKNVSTQLEGFSFSELIINTANREPSHMSGDSRPSIDDLSQDYEIDFDESDGLRDVIVLFDDVITAGTHFKVCKKLIEDNFPDKDVIGIFLARTIHHNDFDDGFEDD